MLVAGTGTEVGKTWVSVHLLAAWRASGLVVAARKPAQSHQPGEGPTDAELLAGASGEAPAAVCPAARTYPVPMAPPMAAEVLGRPAPTLADLVDGVAWPADGADVGLVETAGGVRSPQAVDGDVTDLVAALAPDRLVLVADAGLGTVNAVRLSADCLAGVSSAPLTVVLNRFDGRSDLHRRNLDWLAGRCRLAVVAGTADGLAALAADLVTGLGATPSR